MDQEIRIRAEPSKDLDRCTFTVDRDVYPESAYHFGSAEAAKRSLLAEKIFGVPQVTGVTISNNTVTVAARGVADWRGPGREIGQMIRAVLGSGKPAVDPSVKAALPTPEILKKQVQSVIDRDINPAVANHGGYIDLLDVRGNTVYIRMGGGCQGCSSALMTLKHGVEQILRQHAPDVGDILDTTDHAAGRNPYYAAH